MRGYLQPTHKDERISGDPEMFTPGTRVRDLYEHSETHKIVRKTKAQCAADARYFGSAQKADEWYRVRSDASGKVVMMHREMLAAANN